MWKISYSILVLIFLSAASSPAKITATMGATQSTLRYNGGKQTVGQYMGMGIETSPYSFLLGFEVAFVAKNVLLTNKTWPSSYNWQIDRYVHKGDIPINGSYWEFCTKIGYSVFLLKNKLSVGGYAGPMISQQIDYTDEFRNEKIIPLSDAEIGKYAYDFHRYDLETFPLAINRIVGIRLYYKNVGIEARWVKSYSKQNGFRGLFI